MIAVVDRVRDSPYPFPVPSDPPPSDDWRSPWLRVNLLLRDLPKLYRRREDTKILNDELKKALIIRDRMTKEPGWWS